MGTFYFKLSTMNIREFYVKNYPTDDMGKGINPNATFDGLWNVLKTYGDVYEYLYVYDSIIRERLFEKLSIDKDVDYDVIYNQWLKSA
jgi:hypothetical protein